MTRIDNATSWPRGGARFCPTAARRDAPRRCEL